MSNAATAVSPPQEVDSVPLVVLPENTGFRVYAVTDPDTLYDVSGDPENPVCSCLNFKWRDRTPGYRCPHIEAVFRQLDGVPPVRPPQGFVPQSAAPTNGHAGLSYDGVTLLLKRSVSPDKRIDSLSIEFSVPLDELDEAEVEELALALLARQDGIAATFLDSRQASPASKPASPVTNGAVAVTLRDVGGMQTRYGWRYFINVEGDGKTYKLFGTRRELGEKLTAAGLGQFANRIAKGFAFNTPCLAVLAPSEDGKYLNVASLRPASGNGRP